MQVHEHPDSYTNMLGMFANTSGMFVPHVRCAKAP